MFARPRPAPFAVSLLTHGLILAWLTAGPVREEPKSLYAQAIAPHASKLVWYNFREKLPDVSPTAARKSAKPPRADVKLAQEILAAAVKARRARQFVWQPAPKLELRTDLQSPNVLAIRAPHLEPPPKPKMFVPPPVAPAPTGEAPMLALPRRFARRATCGARTACPLCSRQKPHPVRSWRRPSPRARNPAPSDLPCPRLRRCLNRLPLPLLAWQSWD